MGPSQFKERSARTIAALNGDYQPVAGPADLGNGLQAVGYFGTNLDENKTEYVVHVADTDDGSTAFYEQKFRAGAVDPGDNGLTFEGVGMVGFQSLGNLVIPYPEE